MAGTILTSVACEDIMTSANEGSSTMSTHSIVYLVEPRPVIGGGVRATCNLAGVLGLPPLNCNCTVFGVSAQADLPKRDTDAFRLVCSHAAKSVGGRYIQEVRNVMNAPNVGVVHAMGLYTALLAVLIRKAHKLSLSIVVTVHRVTTDVRCAWFAKRVSCYIARNVDATTFLTEHQRHHYEEYLGYRHASTYIIPNVIPSPQINNLDVMASRQHLQQGADAEYLVGYAGRLIESKQIHVVIRTVAELRSRGCPVGAVIVGSGDPQYLHTLKELARELRIVPHVHFAGFVSRPETYIAACDCILFPTMHGEALPNLLIESFMLGKPVVVSSIPQLRELVIAEENAIIVPTHDPTAYANAVERVLISDEIRNRLSEQALLTYGEQYEPSAVARRYLEVYGRCVARETPKEVH